MALAMVFGVGAYAFEANDIIWTKDAKLKVTDATNKITNGNYAQTDGWISEKGGALDANWRVTTATKDDAQVTVLQSENATNAEGSHLTNAWELPTGIYALSYWIYSPSAVTTSITDGGNNVVSFYVSADGTTVDRQINATTSLAEAAWTQVTDTIQVNSEKETVWFKASQVAQGIQFTDFQIVTVKSVYDTRIAERELAFGKIILEDPNFKTAKSVDVEETYYDLEDAIITIEQKIANNQMETENDATTFMKSYRAALEEYMGTESDDITDESIFQYVTNWKGMALGRNRKDIKHQDVFGNFMFEGNETQTKGSATNWQHRGIASKTAADNPVFTYHIQQGGGDVGSGAVYFYDNTEKLVKGKYYISAEVRNAYQDGKYTPFYTVENEMFSVFGDEKTSIGTISGEEYEKIYAIGEYSGSGEFKIGFRWGGMTGGGIFEIKNPEIRYFGAKSAITDKAARTSAWKTFKEQWNAAVSGRNKVVELQADVTYPWAKDSLERALTKHDVEYNKILNAGWMDADGNDTYAASASNDSLNNWAKYQGGLHVEGDAATYTLVRGYQHAYNYVINKNAPFTNLTAALADAKAVRDDDMNSTGDKTTFQAAIDAAQNTYDNLLASTTDNTFETDSTTLDEARKTLLAAQTVFLKSAEMTPIIDIDFSNAAEEVLVADVTNYVIKGAKGEMNFGTFYVTDKDAQGYTTGYGEGNCDGILRMSNNNQVATVTIADADLPTDDDVLRIKFDYWGGKLNNSKPFLFKLLNAAGEKVASIEWTVDNWSYSVVNDFNNAANTGLDWNGKITWLGESSLSNAQICVDKNKTSVDLIVDYKAQTLRGSMVNGTNGTSNGEAVAFPAGVTDKKIVKISIAATGNNAARRSWFDNLLVYKYPSLAEGPAPVGIKNVKAAADNGAIYDLTGRRIVKAAKGLYIKNGKKYVIK